MGLFTRFAILTISFFIVHIAAAQLCQGSLGDPIVNINFGSGSNPGAPLTAATTAYQYVSGDCPNDGFYTVRSNSTSCFNSSWYNITTDHTGNGQGFFMLVNASIQPSAFYVDTVKGLCSNTTFEFAAWIMNVMLPSACNSNGIQPNLTFTIEKTDGTILQTYNTNNIPSEQTPTWKQYGFFFTTPPGVADIVLRIYNNANGGCGNDLALDDITFRPCGPLLTPSINGIPKSIDTLCQGSGGTYTFSCAVSAGFTNPVFQWQESTNGSVWVDIPGANSLSYNKNFTSGAALGMYFYRLTAAEAGNIASAKCRVSSQPIIIKIVPLPVVSFSDNSPVCEHGTFTITYSGNEAWYSTLLTGGSSSSGGCCGGSGTNSITDIQLSGAGVYRLVFTNLDGCSQGNNITLVVLKKPTAMSAFSSVAVCKGDSVQLSGSGGYAYKWIPSTALSSDSTADPFSKPVDTTDYKLVAYSQAGCSDTTNVRVNVIERPTADAGPDKIIIAGGTTLLDGFISGQDVSYLWSPASDIDDVKVLQPKVHPPVDADYTLTAVSNAGCGTVSDKVHVFVYKDFFIPNAFSPNGDGINDTWNIPALQAFSQFKVSVYNRNGQLIYRAENNNKPWDGNYKGAPQPAGVYVYVIDLKQNIPVFKGTLLLIR